MYEPLNHSMTPIMDKTDSSKIRPFCFVEFYEHTQASAAYSLYHCTHTTDVPARPVPEQYVNKSSNTVGSSSIEGLIEQVRGLSCGHDVGSGATAPYMTAQITHTELTAAPGATVGTELTVDWVTRCGFLSTCMGVADHFAMLLATSTLPRSLAIAASKISSYTLHESISRYHSTTL
jgi:hypothetical protein